MDTKQHRRIETNLDGLFVRVEFVCGHVVTVQGLEPPAFCPKCETEHRAEHHRIFGGPELAFQAFAEAVGVKGYPEPGVVTLRTADHPVNVYPDGPIDGRGYFLRVPLDDGRLLQLEFGAKVRGMFEALILEFMLKETGRTDTIEDRSRNTKDG